MPDLPSSLARLADQIPVPDPPSPEELLRHVHRRQRRRITSLGIVVAVVALAAGLLLSFLPAQTPKRSLSPLAMALTAGRTELKNHGGPAVGALGIMGSDGVWVLDGDGLFTSTDDGGSWTLTSPPSAGDPLADFMSIDYLDLQHGWVVASTENGLQVDRTVDGGATWQVTPLPSSLFPRGWNGAKSVTFINALDGWLTVQPYVPEGTAPYSVLFASTDGGVTWHVVDAKAPIARLTFSDSQLGWGTSPNGTILFRTTDGGSTWHQIDLPTPSTSTPVPSGWQTLTLPVFFGADGVMLAVPEHGNADLERTSDGGSTWAAQESPFTAAPVRMGIAGSQISPCEDCVSPTEEPFAVIDVSSSTYWGGGKLLTTTDSGINWDSIVPSLSFIGIGTATVTVGGQPIAASSAPLQFVSPAKGWAVATIGNQSLLLMTQDGGHHFIGISPPTAPLP